MDRDVRWGKLGKWKRKTDGKGKKRIGKKCRCKSVKTFDSIYTYSHARTRKLVCIWEEGKKRNSTNIDVENHCQFNNNRESGEYERERIVGRKSSSSSSNRNNNIDNNRRQSKTDDATLYRRINTREKLPMRSNHTTHTHTRNNETENSLFFFAIVVCHIS